MTQNSALSQNWVQCTVHTPMAQAEHAARTLRPGRVECRVVVPCRACKPAVSSPPPPPPRSRYKIVLRPKPLPRALSPVSQRSCAVSQGTGRRITAVSRAVSRHKAASLPQYKICIATHPQGPSHARVLPLAPRVGRPCRRAS